MVTTQTSRRLRLRWKGEDGFRTLENLIRPDFDSRGAMSGIVGTAIDLTDNVRALELVSEKESQLALMAQFSSDVIMRVGLDGRVIATTESIQDVLGSDPVKAVGSEILPLIHPDDRGRFAQTLKMVAAGRRESGTIEYRTTTAANPGTYTWVEVTYRLVRDEAGTPREIVGSLRDIRSRKRLEASLKAAREAAEAAAQGKARFLANISHEIRTPMNAVMGFADLLSRQDLPAEAAEQVSHIASSGLLMLELLNDVLDMSRIEAGALALHISDVDLRSMIDDALSLVRPLVIDKDVELVVDVAPDVPRKVRADRLRLRQVVLNLLNNAGKFTDTGTIRVSVERVGEMLEIAVIDSGIGVAEDQRAAIFSGFVQAAPDMHEKYGGSGLGLSISASLAALMSGRISVESEPGKGSRFALTIPLDAADAEEDQADAPDATPTPSAASTGHGRILVAEDNLTNQALIAAILRSLDQEFEIVGNGREAIDLLRERGGGERALPTS